MKKILVIDDEIWIREMVEAALSQKDYRVLTANNGEEGIRRAQTDAPDLVICDVNMDQMDGYQTLARLRDDPRTAAIPFILMTGMADNAGMRHGMELGADDYLPKPFTIDDLYSAVGSRLKKVETMRQEAEKRLSDLRQSISMMLPHELRTPLNGILAYGEILSSDASSLPPEEVAEMGQIIYESGKRLERLIENFLIYAQTEIMVMDKERGKLHQTDAFLLTKRLVEMRATQQAQQAGRAEDLSLNLENPPVHISEDYLGKIVDELVGNAFKFSERGTPVSVSIQKMDHSVVLTISDRGRGMPPDAASQVGAYMQFERKLHEQQGLGLGLVIAKRLTELHGGLLDIQSGQEGGTVVTATFGEN